MSRTTITTVEIRHSACTSRIRIGCGLVDAATAELGPLVVPEAGAVVVSDPGVHGRFGSALESRISTCGVLLGRILLPDGEAAKDWGCVGDRLETLAGLRASRDTLVVTLGGGAITDVGGLLAALYLRGLRVVHVPTTLLGQVDAAIGGKTGVNLSVGKNLAGVLHPPVLVLVDPEVLLTLPDAEFRSGLGEVAKYAVLGDEVLFERLTSGSKAIRGRDLDALTDVVERCVRWKAHLVEADERDLGVRRRLNLGHTLGHAIEGLEREARSAPPLAHGEAVSIGIAFAARISRLRGLITPEREGAILGLFRGLGLPVAAPPVDFDRLWTHMRHDKKRAADRVRLVLPSGNRVLDPVGISLDELSAAWRDFIQAS